MKKVFKSKGFLVTILSVSCTAILAACWLVGRDTKTAFLPDEQPPEAIQEEWKDTTDATAGSWEHADSNVRNQDSVEDKLEDYPRVAEESEQEIVVDFVPVETKEETPPPPPEGRTVITDPGEEHPLNPAPETPPSSTDTGKERTVHRLPAPPVKTELYTIPYSAGLFPDRSTRPLWTAAGIPARWSGTWETDSPFRK